MTLIECRNVVASNPILSYWDPRSRLVGSLRKNLLASSDELISTLSEVIDWDDSKTALVDALVKTASTRWIDLALQRYRLRVGIGQFNREVLATMSQGSTEDTVEFTTTARLTRFEDFDGRGLEESFIVANYKGESLELP